ncbi:MAG: hypothetical protein L0221_10365 [Chloroflexi bacterium]|nr:hypothetical protein [Chloroflexota bacterium]
MSNGRSVGVIAGSIVGLVAVAVVIVLLAERRGPPQFAPGSPEATLQAYLEAWDAGDLQAAYGTFSTVARSRLSLEEYRVAASDWRTGQGGGDVVNVVLIDRSAIDGSRATVFVIVETSYGNGLELNSYRSERDVLLTLEDGTWRIADPLVWLDPIAYYSFK